ncbi:maestro heat-like repeat family member 5 [Ornithorhynchus anatinus]|uniref:maestro heat-like repeat family member 5 n=1 Tax=Ornithorhynchus anatinus TaxID=9258 RepID=UPI0019D4D005|nr:maestro heat-like repeat family member 5 [Ornithorhynchus anatinus]
MELVFLEHLLPLDRPPTLYDLLFIQEYSKTMTQFFPQLFLAFITQVHYVLELGLREDQKQEARKPIVPSNLGPWR